MGRLAAFAKDNGHERDSNGPYSSLENNKLPIGENTSGALMPGEVENVSTPF
jgi:hypothetical protein